MSPQRTSPVIHKLIYELRYDYGYTYLDRCGAVINNILRENPDWFIPEATPQRGIVQRLQDDVKFCFGSLKLDLTHEQSGTVAELVSIEEFARIADTFTKTVVERLELLDFTRIGFRTWRLFEMSTFDVAKQAIVDLEAVPKDKLHLLGMDQVDELSLQIVAETEGVMTRLAVAAVQQNIEVAPAMRKAATQVPHRFPSGQRRVLLDKVKAEKLVKHFPAYAVLVDTDHHTDDPPYPERLSVSEFITSSFASGSELAQRVFHLKG